MVRKILIVDDSPIGRKMMKATLPKDEKFEIHEAVNGLDGLNKYKELKPYVTFLDITMPVMEGIEALEEIIKFDENATVVMVTSDVQPKSISRVMTLGAFEVIKKPARKENVKQILFKIEEKNRCVGGIHENSTH